MKKKHNKGFTLIEVIIYIALFSLLMGSAFVTAYQLIDGSGKLSAKNTVQEEGNFVMRKFNWALTGINPSSTPVISGSGCSQTLSVNKTDTTINPVVIKSNTISGVKYIEIQKKGGTFYPITTVNVLVSCLKFSRVSIGTSSGIIATATINGIDFTITKYIRK